MSQQNIHISKKLLSKTESLMLHGVGFVTGDPTIKLGYPFTFHPGMQVTVTEPGDSKWIYMMLPLQKGCLITDVRIAQHRVGLNSHISLIRLIEQNEPISAIVLHNERIEDTTPSTCVIGSGCSVIVKKSVLLKVCMNFTDTDDMIEIGSVEIRYIPSFVSNSGIDKNEDSHKEIVHFFKINGSHKTNVSKPTLVENLLKKKRKTIF